MRDSAHGNAEGAGRLCTDTKIARLGLALLLAASAACMLSFASAAAVASGSHRHHGHHHRAHASRSHHGRHHARSHDARSHHKGHHAGSASRSMYIKESAKLRRVGKPHGFNLNEKGYVGGTIKGKIYLQLHVTSTKSVTAKVEVRPHGGSLIGYGRGAYGVHGAKARFSGSLSISGGSGHFKGAHGSGLKFSGTIKRGNDAMTVSLSGRLYR